MLMFGERQFDVHFTLYVCELKNMQAVSNIASFKAHHSVGLSATVTADVRVGRSHAAAIDRSVTRGQHFIRADALTRPAQFNIRDH